VNLIPLTSRIDVIIHDADAEWWQIVAAIGPLVVILGAVLIVAIGWRTPRRPVAGAVSFDSQTTTADNQSDWWARARWALEASLDDDPKRREVGLTALQLLNESSLSGKEEASIIAEAWKSPLRDARTISLATEKKSAGDSDPKEERVIVRAARLRLSTDLKQGIESPSWVKEIAQRPL
jgi:hypothetical protein